MTVPLPQLELEASMLDVNDRLEHVTQELGKRARAAASAEHAYRVAFAQQFLVARADGHPIGQCEQIALVACDRLLLERLTADALLESAKEAGRNARAQADTLRSVNSNHRALVVGS